MANKIFNDVQYIKARKANKAICELHDMNTSTNYIGERNLLVADERAILQQANDICIRIMNDYRRENK
jgi:hypothetical protein